MGELKSMLMKRVDVFQQFMDKGMFKTLTLDGDKQDTLIKVLDSVVIKLEGGSDFDLTVLDMPDDQSDESKKDKDKDDDERGKKRKRDKSKDEPVEKIDDEENARLLEKAKEFLGDMATDEDAKKKVKDH